jgi:hypothetical protein
MDIIEIIDRSSPAYYTVEELQFAVEKYIEQKKGKSVKVNIYKGMPENMGLNHFWINKIDAEYSNLMNAFTVVQREYDRTKV